VIGVVAPVEPARLGTVWRLDAVAVPAAYVAGVQRAGGRALLLPPDPDAGGALDGLDALLLIGGADVDPAAYGAARDPATGPSQPERDRFERRLVGEALARDLPLLAICRGAQVVNVAAGGTLIQHLPDLLEARGAAEPDRHRRVAGALDERTAHPVALEPGSLAARSCGGTATVGRSHHHQAIDALGDGWVVSGRDPEDGTVEAIERPDRRFCLGVQWHPEADPATPLFAALAAAAR